VIRLHIFKHDMSNMLRVLTMTMECLHGYKEENQYQLYAPNHMVHCVVNCTCCRTDKDMSCISGCSCGREWFEPVCGSDGLTYFSPCYAGCHNLLGHTVSYPFFYQVLCDKQKWIVSWNIRSKPSRMLLACVLGIPPLPCLPFFGVTSSQDMALSRKSEPL